MSFMSKYKKINDPISVLILTTLSDHGIKSLGNKSLIKIKQKPIVVYQIECIKKALRSTEYEIVIVCSFDCTKIEKTIKQYMKNTNVRIVYEQSENINFGGALMTGIFNASYENILYFNYGLVFRNNVLTPALKERENNFAIIAKNHLQNENVDVGCFIEDNTVSNLFFNLAEHKYLDCAFFHKETIRYLRKHTTPEQYRNKFTFEIINKLLEKFTFDAKLINSRDALMIDSQKTLNKSKRFINNDRTRIAQANAKARK